MIKIQLIFQRKKHKFFHSFIHQINLVQIYQSMLQFIYHLLISYLLKLYYHLKQQQQLYHRHIYNYRSTIYTRLLNCHMKKHLTSIQSTRPAEEISLISYDDRQMKLNYKNQILKIISYMESVIRLRSFILFRDLQELFSNSQNFFFKILGVSTVEQLFAFAFPNKTKNDKIHQKQQIAFLVKLVLQLDQLRKAAANEARTKDFQIYKAAMQLLQEKITLYEQAIRQKKNQDKLSKKIKEKQQREDSFNKFQQAIKQTLSDKQKNMKTSFLQKIHRENETAYTQIQKTTARQMYKFKPSKLLSDAKDLSLRVKLSPYAAELKRDYDFKTLQNTLSKTLDMDTSRKLSMIAHMKKVQKEKINRDHRKRYSVMEQHFTSEKNLTQRQLAIERKTLQKSLHIQFEKMNQKNVRKQYDRVNSLQKSLNAYNLNSDSKEIRRILRNHKETTQFSNQISQVTDLRTSKDYNPLYGTLTNRMLESEYVMNERNRQNQHQKKILRKFNVSKPMKSIQNQQDSDAQADDVCGTKQVGKKMARERSLVALYDNELNQCK